MDKEQNKTQRKTGTETEALPSTTFRVQLDGGPEIIAHLAGKLRMYRIKVLPGDRVTVETNEYSKDKGRITRRL